jgi:hypothetical protein
MLTGPHTVTVFRVSCDGTGCELKASVKAEDERKAVARLRQEGWSRRRNGDWHCEFCRDGRVPGEGPGPILKL